MTPFDFRHVTSQLRSNQGVVQVLSYFIQKDNSIYIFHGFSTVDRFYGYLPTFHGTIRQFKNLTDLKKIKKKPDRICIRPATMPGPLRQVLLTLGGPEKNLQPVAIMNGRGLDEHVPTNTLIKVVEKGG